MVRGRITGRESPFGGWVWFWAVLDTAAPVGYQLISEGVLDTWDAAMERVRHWLAVEG